VSVAVPRPEVRTIGAAPRSAAVWNQSLAHVQSHATPAHSPEWFEVIRGAYGHDPLYLCAEDSDGNTAVLPAFIVRRPVVGTVVTSMPFLDSGGPCGGSASLAATLVSHVIEEAGKIGARSVELRCVEPLQIAHAAMERKVNMTLALPGDADVLWRRLDKTVRNQVRKAARSGLSIEVGGTEKLADFYDVFAARMRDLGSPVHARHFLGAVLDCFGSRARIVLVRRDGVTVGGLIAIRFNDRLAVPWAACLQQYFSLCPNMLLYWETLRSACSEGFRRFDFGRSTRDSGTYRFKRQWGAEEEPLFWYTIPLRRRPGSATGGASRRADLAVRAWQRLPLSVTRRLGPRIRKYLTQ
jgi:FemAB-related protein (PEP-CTERM system-associated)